MMFDPRIVAVVLGTPILMFLTLGVWLIASILENILSHLKDRS